ncbi:MAG: phosphoenolpyruvate synthase [Chloroflexi bacterium]|nr:MAG: phosphoenolpyruvate synthase [Chloroflexota bacterium]
MKFIRMPESIGDEPVGGKARALARLSDAGLPVPAWFVVLPAALSTSLAPAQWAVLAGATSSEKALALFDDLSPAASVCTELRAALAALGLDNTPVAVRSSAGDEDGAQHSFAGQLESFLNVPPADVAARIVDVWRSGFSERVYAYRRKHNLPLPPQPPAVIVQRMVPAEVAGVAFSADPVSGRRGVAVVSAVRGLGDALVSGVASADTYRIARDEAISERSLVRDNDPVLTDAQVQAVAGLARRVERAAQRPQDIEWASVGDRLYLLQARPVTALAHRPDPDGVFTLWDNSNIVESYGGVTTPLTYSFARRAYEAVYQEFCRILGVPDSTIAANQHVFAAMIGLIRGRVYYNLLNWYLVLALLPGFRTNRRFMEQMMGVKESLPDTIVRDLEQSTWRQRVGDRLALLRTSFGLLANHFLLPRRIRRFYGRLERALGKQPPDLTVLRADELVAYYRQLERELLRHWDAPLVNDFFAMIFYGLLRRLVTQWANDHTGALQNDLLVGEGGMISAEPAHRVRELATLAAQEPALAERLRTGVRGEIEALLPAYPLFAERYYTYLNRFGDRCQNELKLESPTLNDDPLPLLRSIGHLALHPSDPDETRTTSAGRQAEAHLQTALAGKPLRRALLWWVLGHARARVRDRENLRFERTRVFGRARQIFVELGRCFYAVDGLDQPRDIFYLQLDEVLGFVDGTTPSTELKALAAVRKAEFARFAEGSPPASRFVTYGMVHQGHDFQAEAEPTLATPTGETLQGLGCCPGVVRGRARVVADPLATQLAPGDILVAERTDPSWIMIMPAAAGLLVERGSLLSHAAIVARELGLPAIVGLTGVTRWLADGDVVEMDGRTGLVQKLNN